MVTADCANETQNSLTLLGAGFTFCWDLGRQVLSRVHARNTRTRCYVNTKCTSDRKKHPIQGIFIFET